MNLGKKQVCNKRVSRKMLAPKFVKKMLGPKNFKLKRNVGPKIFWFKKNYWSKNICQRFFLGPKFGQNGVSNN